MNNEMNFTGRHTTSSDISMIFGPLSNDDGPFVSLQDGWTLAHVMHYAGLFASVGEAKKNGWSKPVPDGYSEFIVGKRKFKVFIWKPVD